MPRHPPYALNSLATFIKRSPCGAEAQQTVRLANAKLHATSRRRLMASNAFLLHNPMVWVA